MNRQAENNWLPLEWFAEPVAGKSFALNSAIPRITSDLVALVDDDHRIPDDFLVNICRVADAQPDTALFCGRILPDWDGTEPGWVRDDGDYKIYPPPIPCFELGDVAHFVTGDEITPGGGNLFVRREVFGRVGEFSTELGPQGHDLGGGEDTAFVLRPCAQGVRMSVLARCCSISLCRPRTAEAGFSHTFCISANICGRCALGRAPARCPPMYGGSSQPMALTRYCHSGRTGDGST